MILGIDTSNYTTSVAVVSREQQLLFDQRTVLKVAEGERGLQQSAAVFQHLQNLPGLLTAALTAYPEIRCVCYSAKPRPMEGSYMPVFRAGEGFAQTVAAAMKVPSVAATHQEGHIMAGLWSAGFRPTGPFLVMHLSGGTTDLLHVEPVKRGFAIKALGSSSDLHAGQFVDRIGVKMGLPFPAGPALEILARGAKGDGETALAGQSHTENPMGTAPAISGKEAEMSSYSLQLPSSVSGYTISFSGPCSAAERQIGRGADPVWVAFAVFRCVANSVEKVLKKAMAETGLREVLFVGGVAANQLIRQRLIDRLSPSSLRNVRLYFAGSDYSRDNAVGIGLLGLETLRTAVDSSKI